MKRCKGRVHCWRTDKGEDPCHLSCIWCCFCDAHKGGNGPVK